MKIVRLEEKYIDACCTVENECFSRPWSRLSFEGELKNKTSVFFVCLESGEVIGCAAMNDALGEGFISKVAVRKDFRRRGAAKALLKKFESYALENSMFSLTLEVRESNFAARALYLGEGFKDVGRRKNFYSSPDEDAIIMTKDMNK